MPASTFAVLLALAPAIAATAGFVVLGQELSVLSWIGVGCVVLAGAGATLVASRQSQRPDGRAELVADTPCPG